MVNGSAAVQERYHYTPYGQTTFLDSSFANPAAASIKNQEYLYTGRQLDSEAGLLNCRARYYHSTIGRFINRDIIEYLHGASNLYLYVHGIPIRFSDPSGNIPLDTILGNVIYDIAVGDYVSLTVDAAALVTPYVPAGATKVLRIGKNSWKSTGKVPVAKIERIIDKEKIRRVNIEYQYVGRLRYPKHFRNSGAHWVQRTKNGPSLWKPGTTDEQVKCISLVHCKTQKEKAKLSQRK